MALKPDITDAEWALLDVIDPVTAVNNKIEPPTIKKNNGWNRLEKPPREYTNWMWYEYYKWISFINDFFDYYSGQTTNANVTEIFLNGVANSRLTINDNSNIVFDSIISAISNDSSQSKSWNVKGEIIRNGNAFLPTDISKEIISQNNWDVSTASYASKSFSVATQSTNPTSVFFKPDGLAMFVIDGTSAIVYQYTLSTAWDVSTASYASKSFNASTQESAPQALFFKPDGKSMYVLGITNDTVYQYTLSTAWDVSTASYASKSFSVASEDPIPVGLSFKPDGLTMFMIGDTANSVYQYTLSTAWDVSTASYASKSFSVGTQDGAPTSVFFKPDGKSMYAAGNTNDTVYQYTLSTAWDVSTASYASKSFSVTSQDTNPLELSFKPDGISMYIMGNSNNTVYQYTLNLPWDINFEADIVNNALVPKVIGETSKTINWKIKLEKLINQN